MIIKPIKVGGNHQKSVISDAPPNQERSAKYDYKDLMKANVNLIDIIDSGKTVHFDCPPINFNQIDFT